jgi:hypothetical protein
LSATCASRATAKRDLGRLAERGSDTTPSSAVTAAVLDLLDDLWNTIRAATHAQDGDSAALM